MFALLLTVARKVGFFLAVLFGVSFAIIVLGRLVPGDAIDQLTSDPQVRQAMLEEMGLERPLVFQYLAWWGKVLAGDFGQSWVIRQGEPVASLVGPAVLKSLSLILPALVVNFGLAWALMRFFGRDGLNWAKGPVRLVAHAISVLPLFLLGDLLISGINSQTYPWIEAERITRPAWFALPGNEHWFKYLLAVLVLAVGNGTLSDLTLHLTEEVGRVRESEFLLSVWARGARVAQHMALNLVVPLSTLFVNRMTFLLGGIVVVETVFNINGMGSMIWRAANQRDIPVVIAITFLVSAGVALLQLVSDLLQVVIDPRVRT